MIVLSGPSASGKTEVAKLLNQKYGFERVITTTTRKIRDGEVNHIDYHFLTVDEFKNNIVKNKFVEYTLYNGNYYGSSIDEIKDNKVIAIEPNGMKKYISLNNPTIITFYLYVDEETRFKRMLQRGDTEENARERIKEDRNRFTEENIPSVDFIINTKEINAEQVCDLIYKEYLSKLKQ